MNVIEIEGYSGYKIKIELEVYDVCGRVNNTICFCLKKNNDSYVVGNYCYYNDNRSSFDVSPRCIINYLYKKYNINDDIINENIKILLKLSRYIISRTDNVIENFLNCAKNKYGIKL